MLLCVLANWNNSSTLHSNCSSVISTWVPATRLMLSVWRSASRHAEPWEAADRSYSSWAAQDSQAVEENPHRGRGHLQVRNPFYRWVFMTRWKGNVELIRSCSFKPHDHMISFLVSSWVCCTSGQMFAVKFPCQGLFWLQHHSFKVGLLKLRLMFN